MNNSMKKTLILKKFNYKTFVNNEKCLHTNNGQSQNYTRPIFTTSDLKSDKDKVD